MSWSLLTSLALLERDLLGGKILEVAVALCLVAAAASTALAILVKLFRWSRVEELVGPFPSAASPARAHDERTCPLCKATREGRTRGRRLTPLRDPRA